MLLSYQLDVGGGPVVKYLQLIRIASLIISCIEQLIENLIFASNFAMDLYPRAGFSLSFLFGTFCILIASTRLLINDVDVSSTLIRLYDGCHLLRKRMRAPFVSWKINLATNNQHKPALATTLALSLSLSLAFSSDFKRHLPDAHHYHRVNSFLHLSFESPNSIHVLC